MDNQDSEPQIGVNALAYYLKRICTFLESEKKTLSFPKITEELQDILLRVVVESPEFLDTDEFSDAVRMEAARVATVLKEQKAKNVRVSGEICDGKHGANVLSYIKSQGKPDAVIKSPEPLRKPSETKTTEMPPPDDSVTPIFKMRCLKACHNFVKDDTQLSMRFPEMTAEQAQFLINVIKPGKEGKSVPTEGNRTMYGPLWESMRLYSLKYDYHIDYDTCQVTKEGMKRVVFEKIPKTKRPEPTGDPEIIDVDALEDTPDTYNTHSIETSVAKKKPDYNLKVTKIIANRLKSGCWPAGFIHEACQMVADFLLDDEKKFLVFQDISTKQMLFIELLHKVASVTSTYMLFTSEVQTYLDSISYSYNVKKVRYNTKRSKGSNKQLTLEKKKVKNAKTCLDDDIESISSIASVSSRNSLTSRTSKADSKSSKKSKKKEKTNKQPPTPKKTRIANIMEQLRTKLGDGKITEEFIQDTLERIWDFLNDEQQASILFQRPTPSQTVFLQNLRLIIQSKPSHTQFNEACEKLLGCIRDTLNSAEGRMMYNIETCKGGKDMKIFKKVVFPTKPCKCENTCTSKHGNAFRLTPLGPMRNQATIPTNLDEVVRLKAVIYDVLKDSGDQAVIDILSDISHFLTADNIDRSITFDDLTDIEAKFVKQVHAASKTEDVYPMFTRDCQKLLKSIRENARNYKLSVKMMLDETKKQCWTTIIEKRAASPEKPPIQHRARSLSAGRRAAKLAATLKIQPIPRGSSGQRPSKLKEKLIAALAQPVQSDKALKMMQSMGWKGGALGPRGDGITEPIALRLDLVTRAGLGHVPPPKRTREPRNKRQPRPEAPAPSRLLSQTEKSIEWLKNLAPPGIFPGVEPPPKSKTISVSEDYHCVVLKGILEIITTDVDMMFFVPNTNKSPEKIFGFIKHVVNIFNNRSNTTSMCNPLLTDLVSQIVGALKNNFDIELYTDLRESDVMVKKSKLIPITRRKNKQDVILLTDTENPIIGNNKKSKDGKTNNDNTNIEDKADKSKVDWHERASRQWYFPVIKSDKKTSKTTDVPTLKTLALSKTFECIGGVLKEAENNTQAIEEVIVINEDDETIQQKILEDCEKEGIMNSTDDPNSVITVTNSKVTNITNENTANKKDVAMDIDGVKNTETQAIEVLNQPDMPSAVFKEIGNKTIPETDKEIDPKILDETAIEIQKALEKLLNIKQSKENITQKNIETVTNKNMPCSSNINDQISLETNVKPRVKTLVKNITLPNMTRKQLALLKEYGAVPDVNSQKTTYKLRVEEYKLDNVKHVDVKVDKYTAEMASNEAKRRRMKKNIESISNERNLEVKESTSSNETADIEKSPGIILLEKLTLNNNSSTQNKNQEVSEKKTKSTSANRLVNAISSIDSTADAKKDNKNNNAVKTNNESPNVCDTTRENVSSVPNKPAPMVNKVAPMVKGIETIGLTRDEDNIEKVNCSDNANTKESNDASSKNNENIKTRVDMEKLPRNNSDATKDETETITYIMPVECEKIIEIVTEKADKIIQNDIDTHDNENRVANKNDTAKTNDVITLDNDKCQSNKDDDSVSTVITNSKDKAVQNKIKIDELSIANRPRVSASKRDYTKYYATSYNEVFYDTIDVPIENEKERKSTLTSERKRQSSDSDSVSPHHEPKKSKSVYDFRKVHIQSKDHPQTVIDKKKAREIQSAILNSIDYTKQPLPILKCQGIQNGGLAYDCLDEKSLFFLEELVKEMADLKLTYVVDRKKMTHKMAFRINSYIEEPVANILNRLDLYNTDLHTTNWLVLKKEFNEDFCVIKVEMDANSFDYVCSNNFVLCAGNDCARFSILWE